MTPGYRRYLAQAAAREVNVREKFYGQVRAGQVERGDRTDEEMNADLAAWRVIAALFADGTADTTISWAELELWTARALQSREQAADADPANEGKMARRDAVWAIHQRIAHRREMITDLNSALRERAERKAAA